jgi:hypothetical protein
MNKKITILIVAACAILLVQCKKSKEIIIKNNAEYFISVYPSYFVDDLMVRYPDTSLDVNLLHVAMAFQPVGNSLPLFLKSPSEVFEQYGVDTLSFYVMNSDKQQLIQRYDVSVADLDGLVGKHLASWLSFPPTEEMKNIKMWPPYGTYDANGHRIDSK